VANGVAYTSANYGGRLDAFDATTGVGKWTYPIGSGNYAGIPSPAVANGVVYDVAGDGTVYAIDATSGSKLWSHSLEAGSSPVVANGVVYVVNGALNAFNATTGVLLWSSGSPHPYAPLDGTPAVANGVVYVVDEGGGPPWGLDAFDATTGRGLWSKFGTGPIFAPSNSPAVANGIVYVASDHVVAFDATTGTTLWSAATGSNNGGASTSPAIANHVVYDSGGDGRLRAFDATTGAVLWSASASIGWYASSPVVANGAVYADRADGTLMAFDAKTGTQLWSSTATGMAGRPVIANGVLYVGSDDAHLYAYSLPVAGAALTMSPTFNNDYGTVVDGTSSTPTTFTVTNFGSTATTALTDALGGADPAPFHVTVDTCAGSALAAGASCTIAVTFAPTTPVVPTATLTVHAATGGTTSATMSGIGNPLTITPDTFDYGNVLDGTSSPPTTFTVTNHSTSPVSPTVASLAGSPFTATSDTCSRTTLAHGASCRIAVKFTAPAADFLTDYQASLSVSSTASITTIAKLSATPMPIAITPPSKDYGTVPVGSSSPATFTITNVSSVALPVPFYESAVTGNGFSITSDGCYGVTLAAGANCTIVVTFAPTAAGTTYQGQLTPTLDYVGAMNEATLVGKGG
jgi:outer membrane protein assembly factor BamB